MALLAVGLLLMVVGLWIMAEAWAEIGNARDAAEMMRGEDRQREEG